MGDIKLSDDDKKFIETNEKIIASYEKSDKILGEDHTEDIKRLKKQIEDVKSGIMKIEYSWGINYDWL